MKELSIEEKAKRYDEAIEKAKDYHKQLLDEDNPEWASEIERIFPELKESEDERIRKALMQNLKERFGTKGNMGEGLDMPDVLAWLEKQGEKKSIWHNEDEEPQKDSLILLIMQSGTPIVAKIIEPNHTFNHGERWAYIDDLLEKQGEQKHDNMDNKFIRMRETKPKDISEFLDRLTTVEQEFLWEHIAKIRELDKEDQKPAWSEEDEDMCYKATAVINRLCAEGKEYVWSINTLKTLFYWLKSLKGKVQLQPMQEWGEEDIMRIDNLIAIIENKGYPDYVEYLEKLKDRVQPQPQQQWSEEDENLFRCAIDAVREESKVRTDGCLDEEVGEMVIDWLKSLKERCTWKPSDEQLYNK